MLNVLIISAIGMGLVFFGIVLLWGLMELLVKLTNDKPAQSNAEPVVESTAEILSITSSENPGKEKIAAAAVAAAIAIRKRQAAVQAVKTALADGQTQEYEQTGSRTSNWQPVMRAAQREDRLRLFSRKPRRSSS